MANTSDLYSTITLTITPEGQCWTDHPREELAGMLRKLADQLDAGWYASFQDLPEALHDSNGNPTGTVEVRLAPEDDPTTWLHVLIGLPGLADAHGSDLKVDNGLMRVWLSRLGTDDGEPFARTVHVEEWDADTEAWHSAGYFDATEPNPHPVGVLGHALMLSRQAAALERRHGRG